MWKEAKSKKSDFSNDYNLDANFLKILYMIVSNIFNNLIGTLVTNMSTLEGEETFESVHLGSAEEVV